MEIRKANTGDIDAVLSITSACAKDMISKGIFQWSEEYPSKQSFENDIENNCLYVIGNENKNMKTNFHSPGHSAGSFSSDI